MREGERLAVEAQAGWVYTYRAKGVVELHVTVAEAGSNLRDFGLDNKVAVGEGEVYPGRETQ